jgi:hypothetical protein
MHHRSARSLPLLLWSLLLWSLRLLLLLCPLIFLLWLLCPLRRGG